MKIYNLLGEQTDAINQKKKEAFSELWYLVREKSIKGLVRYDSDYLRADYSYSGIDFALFENMELGVMSFIDVDIKHNEWFTVEHNKDVDKAIIFCNGLFEVWTGDNDIMLKRGTLAECKQYL